jgi:hypothetical protein
MRQGVLDRAMAMAFLRSLQLGWRGTWLAELLLLLAAVDVVGVGLVPTRFF